MEQKLSLLISARDEASAKLKGVQGSVDNINKSMKDSIMTAGKWGGAMAVGVGAAITKAGMDVDKANSIIVKGTGASGEALKEMLEITREINREVPQDMQVVAQAVADINTRLDLTGEELKIASKQMLDFARVTGGDVASSVRSITRLMGDWDIQDTNQLLDQLTKASQMSGVGVDQLSGVMVNYGVQLRALGFKQEEAIALLSKFEKEGVATEKIFSGLSMALGRLARAGVDDTAAAFKMLTGEIAATGSTGEAVREAIEILGTRAGPDFALAVLEGRFAIDDYVTALEGAEGTLQNSAAASLTFSDELKMLKDNLFDAITPSEELRAKIIEITKGIVEWVKENKELVAKVIVAVGAIGGFLAALALAIKAVGVMKVALILLASPLGIIIAAVVALYLAWESNFLGIQDITLAVWSWIRDFLTGLWLGIEELVTDVTLAIYETIKGTWEWITETTEWLKDTVHAIWSGIWNGVLSIFNTIWSGIQSVIGAAYDWVAKKLEGVLNMVSAIKNALSAVGASVSSHTATVKELGVAGALKAASNAKGGIITQPTLSWVGEGGMNEAIVPLPDGRSIPVQMQGGREINISFGNINISGSGSPESFAERFIDKVKDSFARDIDLLSLKSM